MATAVKTMDQKAVQDHPQDVQQDSKDATLGAPAFELKNICAAFESFLQSDSIDHKLATTPDFTIGTNRDRTLLVVDSRAKGVNELLANPPADTQIKILDAKRDGYRQIAELLQERGNTTDLRIMTGTVGSKSWLGSSRLSNHVNTDHTESIMDWGNGLAENARITFYGEKGISGHSWSNHIRALTGVQVSWVRDTELAAIDNKGGNSIDLHRHNADARLKQSISDVNQFTAHLKSARHTAYSQTRAYVGEEFGMTQTGDLATSTAATISTAALRTPHSLVFVDTKVNGYQTLLEGIDPNATVILLDPAKDGIAQMAQAVSQYDNIAAIHIISHGEVGQITLGSAILNQTTMQGMYANELASIGRHLTANADILIYGCNFGQGEIGLQATNQLAALTGADVADSTNNTGNSVLGGDWVLERQTGSIESYVVVSERAQADFMGLLAPLTISAGTAPVVTPGPNATNVGGTITPITGGNIVGTTALYRSVGVTGGITVDLKATVTSVAAGDTNDTIIFTRAGTQPEVQLDGGTGGSKVTIHWEILQTGTNTPVAVDMAIAVNDIDGPNLESVAASTQFGLTSYTTDTGSHLTVTTVGNQVNATGTQDENGGRLSAIRFTWANVSSVDFVYTNSTSGVRFYDHDGANGITFNRPIVTVLTAIDLDTNNSTTTGNGYVNTFTENGAAVSIIDIDPTITAPPASFTGGAITLTNLQANDSLNVGTLPAGITFTRDTSVSGQVTIKLTGVATPADYLLALKAITFSNSSENPNTADRIIQVGLNNGANFTNVAVSTIHVIAINDAPTVTMPASTSTNEETTLTINSIVFDDRDAVSSQ